MRSGISISMAALALTTIAGTTALAAPGDGASGFPWEGEVSGMNVYLRSGPGANYYPTAKLNAGDRVLVLGEKFGWYQLVPPPGSFSYVERVKVQRQAGAQTGTVLEDKVYVRAGSVLGKRKTSTQVILDRGATVEILGEAEGFYKIVPPAGASLYISKDYVQFVPAKLRQGLAAQYLSSRSSTPKPRTGVAGGEVKAAAAVTGGGNVVGVTKPGVGAATEQVASAEEEDAAPLIAESALQMAPEDAASSGSESEVGKSAKEGPADRPATAFPGTTGRYQTLLTVLESELRAMLDKPLGQQDLSSFVARYGEIAEQQEESLPSRIAKIRVGQLADLIDLRLARRELDSDVTSLNAFRSQMEAERMKIVRRRAEAVLEKFDFEGELMRSHAFAPEKRRYRLVDPETRSTIAYVDVPRGVDRNVNEMIGRLVGIHTAGKRFSPSAGVPIAVAASITDMTPRMPLADPEKMNLGSGTRNKGGELAKSTPETAKSAVGSEPTGRSVAAAGEEEEE